MKDFLGQELAVGDTVVAVELGYRSLKKVSVVALTPTKVRLSDRWGLGSDSTWLQEPRQIVKVPAK